MDFATGGCLKWLCGGPGNGFLYTRPDLLRTLTPRFTGWLALANPFAFDIETGRLREDAMRMMNGTPAIPAYYAAIPGLDIVARSASSAIRDEVEPDDRPPAGTRGRTRLAARRRRATRERVAGTVAIDVPDALAASRALKARDVLVDYRPTRRHPRVAALLQHVRGNRPAGATDAGASPSASGRYGRDSIRSPTDLASASIPAP